MREREPAVQQAAEADGRGLQPRDRLRSTRIISITRGRSLAAIRWAALMRQSSWPLSLFACAALAVQPAIADMRVFQHGDRVLVLGRLAECREWTNRPLQIELVPESGEVVLLGLPAIAVAAKSPELATKLLLDRYRKARPKGDLPSLRIELLRGEQEYRAQVDMYVFSLRAMINRDCLVGPSPPKFPDYQVPPPGVPGLLDRIAQASRVRRTI
jgi:hypothetical protein